jgi:hypothetical protein
VNIEFCPDFCKVIWETNIIKAFASNRKNFRRISDVGVIFGWKSVISVGWIYFCLRNLNFSWLDLFLDENDGFQTLE